MSQPNINLFTVGPPADGLFAQVANGIASISWPTSTKADARACVVDAERVSNDLRAGYKVQADTDLSDYEADTEILRHDLGLSPQIFVSTTTATSTTAQAASTTTSLSSTTTTLPTTTVVPTTAATITTPPGSPVQLTCKVLSGFSTPSGLEYIISATVHSGSAYIRTVNISFHGGQVGQKLVFPPTSVQADLTVTYSKPWIADLPVPEQDVGASAEPDACVATLGGE